jgi:hypothetical protein
MLPSAIFTLSAVLWSRKTLRPRIASVSLFLSIYFEICCLTSVRSLIAMGNPFSASGPLVALPQLPSRHRELARTHQTSPQHDCMTPTASILVWAQDPIYPGRSRP